MLDLILPDDAERAAMVLHTRQLLLEDASPDAMKVLYGGRSEADVTVNHLDYSSDEALRPMRDWLERRVRRHSAFEKLLGRDPVFLHALALAQQQAVAAEELHALSPVLIQGDSGSGKELLARAIHDASGLAGRFVPVHCAGITETLLEAALFGHAPHAFSDAGRKEKKGLVDEAEGGTLFLDELGDLPMRAQVTLLRFLQDQRYRRVGSTTEIQANVRVVCATWQDLDAMVDSDEFREDLFYRLAGARIFLPGLSDRRHELIYVATQMLHRAGIEADPPMDDQVRLALEHTDWPGGFRQLDMELCEAARLSGKSLIGLRHLPSRRVAAFHRKGQAMRLASEVLAWGPAGERPDDATLHRRADRVVDMIRVPDPQNDPEMGLLQSVQSAFEEDDRPHKLITRVVDLVADNRQVSTELQALRDVQALLKPLELPPLAKRHSALTAQQEANQKEMNRLSGEITARLPGLFQLFQFVNHVPGLDRTEKAQLFRSFANIIHLLMMLAPTFAAAWVKRVASSTIEEMLLEVEGQDPNNPFLQDLKPEHRPEADWRWLAMNTRSLREAGEVSGHSRNTVKNYFERYQLTNSPQVLEHQEGV